MRLRRKYFRFHSDVMLFRCLLSPFNLWYSSALKLLCWFLLGMTYAGMGVEYPHYHNYFMRICLNFIFIVNCFMKFGFPNYDACIFTIVLTNELFLLWRYCGLLYLLKLILNNLFPVSVCFLDLLKYYGERLSSHGNYVSGLFVLFYFIFLVAWITWFLLYLNY